MRAGLLRHRVSIESYVGTQDTTGDEVQAWTAVQSVWAHVSPVSATETYEANQSVHRITHEIRIRANAYAVDNTMRVNHGGRYFYLEGLKDPELRGIINIWMASERADQP